MNPRRPSRASTRLGAILVSLLPLTLGAGGPGEQPGTPRGAAEEAKSVSTADPSTPRTASDSDPAPTRGAAAVSGPVLRFGRPPHLTVAGANAECARVVRHLSKILGRRIELVVPDTYEAVVDQMVAGRLDLALLTPFVYVAVKDRLPSVVLLAGGLGEGTTLYRGYIVVKTGSGLDSLEALRGKRFAFVDRLSASGYLFPLLVLQDAGIGDPDRYFGTVAYAGAHSTLAQWILQGRVDAGALSSTTFNLMRSEALGRRLEIIAKTPWLPFDALVAHPKLPVEQQRQIKEAVLNLDIRTSEGREVLADTVGTSGFIEITDAYYEDVRRAVSRLREHAQKKRDLN